VIRPVFEYGPLQTVAQKWSKCDEDRPAGCYGFKNDIGIFSFIAYGVKHEMEGKK